MRAQHSTAHQSSGKKINENELHHQRINASTSGKEEGTERNRRCRAVQLALCSCRDESKEKKRKEGRGVWHAKAMANRDVIVHRILRNLGRKCVHHTKKKRKCSERNNPIDSVHWERSDASKNWPEKIN